MDKTGLIPSRFVALIGHFVMLTMALNCRDTNVKACLPYNYDLEDYNDKDKELLIGIFIALAFLGVEMFGFLFGFSMFMPLVASISVGGHVLACITLSYWLVDTWDCVYFWWVFFFCSFIPGVTEIGIITNMLGDKWTPLLLLAATVSTFGFAVPAGYCLGVLNTPVEILRSWCNQTLMEERGVILTISELDFMWTLIVSVFLIGGVLGGIIGAWFADHMGRRGTLVFGNVLNVISGCLFFASKFVPSVEMFFVARIISGFTVGLMTTVVPMYLNELSPPLLTGLMGMFFPIGLTIGILTSQIMGLNFLLGTESLWPYLISGYILTTLVVFASLPYLPESPKYLHEINNEQEKALEQLTRLRNLPRDVVAWEIVGISGSPRHLIQEKWSMIRVLTTARLRIPLSLVIILQAGQQFSGINAVFYYSANIFEAAGLNKESIPYANIGTGFINFAVTACGMGLVNKLGRRPLLIVSCSMTSLTLILLALSSKYTDYATWIPSLSVVFVLSFVFVYDLGLGPIPFFIGAELVDIGPRPTVMALGSVANYGANFLVAVGYTSIHNLLHEWIFTVFAASTFFVMVFVTFYLPETRSSNSPELRALLHRRQHVIAEHSTLENPCDSTTSNSTILH